VRGEDKSIITQPQVTSTPTLEPVDGTASRHVRYLLMSLYTCGVIIIMEAFDRRDVTAMCVRDRIEVIEGRDIILMCTRERGHEIAAAH